MLQSLKHTYTHTHTHDCVPLLQTCAPLSSSSSTVMSAEVPFSLTLEFLPCQQKYTQRYFPGPITRSEFSLFPTGYVHTHTHTHRHTHTHTHIRSQAHTSEH